MSTKAWGEILDEAEESGGFKLLPKATYVVRVFKAKIKEAKTKKKGVGVTWKVQVGPEKGGYVHKDFWVDVDDPQQMGNFIKAMKVMGATFIDMPSDFEAGLELIADQIMGGMAVIKVDHRDWQDDTRHEVAPWDVKPYEGPALEPGDEAAPAAEPGLESAGEGQAPQIPF